MFFFFEGAIYMYDLDPKLPRNLVRLLTKTADFFLEIDDGE